MRALIIGFNSGRLGLINLDNFPQIAVLKVDPTALYVKKVFNVVSNDNITQYVVVFRSKLISIMTNLFDANP